MMNISSVLYTIVLAVCSLSGIQSRPLPPDGVVYLWAENLEMVLPDYSMITSQDFPDTESTEDNDIFIEGIWCLHHENFTYGIFYYPNATKVTVFTGTFLQDSTTNDYNGPDPVFQTDEQFTHTVLLRDEDSTTPITSDYEGLYKCIIVNRTLVVGVYNTSTYNDNTGPEAGDMSLSLISTPRYVDPPVFNLSFIVTNGPPTYVTCTEPNSFSINQTSDDLSREVMNDGTATLVTMTVRMREGGNYQCIVSNARVEDGTVNGVTATEDSTSLHVSVSDTPTLTLTRLGTNLLHVQLSWTGSSPRYEVFYSLSGSDDIQSLVNTTFKTYTLTGLTQDQTYEFFVVSYGNDGTPVLPSVNNSIENVTLTVPSVSDLTATSTSNTINLTWTEPDPIPSNGYNATRQCRRLCEESFSNLMQNTSSSSPLVFSGINPGSYCTISLFFGTFGTESIAFDSGNVVTTLSAEPTSFPEIISFSSVEARSMIVLWDEVPCFGQNGRITGYFLYYTNTTFSDTINITGGENRTYTLTELRPYTSYTVTVSAYNDAGTGPTSDNRAQQTEQAEPGLVGNLFSSGSDVNQILSSWEEPSITNGYIIVYELRYGESDTAALFTFVNTTNLDYTIDGLLPFTIYIVGVRAYTIAGPGEWTDTQVSTLSPGIEVLIVEILEIEDIVIINWTPLNYTELTSYVLEYKQTNEQTFQTITFPASVVSTGSPRLQYDIEYVFQVYGVFTINNVEHESKRSPQVTVLITMDSSSTTSSTPSSTTTSTSLSTTSLTPSSTTSLTPLSTTSSTPSSTTSSTPSLISSSNDSKTGSTCTGLVAGISVLSIIVIILIIIIIIIIIIVVLVFIKQTNSSYKEIQKSTVQPSREALMEDSKKDIEMKDSLAYGHVETSLQTQQEGQ